ncbi:MAG: hypothetical protein PHV36_01740 [Elusimicrobiales bacterium]|nr:hypothetical protein [Elusimicrobiales bacterium]
MNELETSELFNRELDALLQGGQERPFGPDGGAMALAGELVRADFSGRSLIKESLRGRLTGKEAGGFVETPRSLFSGNYARAAMAAAILVVALLPLARRHSARVPGPAAPSVLARLPLAPSAEKTGSRLPDELASSYTAPAEGLFAPIPMARLETEPIKYFPISQAGTGSPIVVAEGREVKLENGSGIVFETGSGVFTLERRAVSLEDIFERKVI